jgi:hypothetical protein
VHVGSSYLMNLVQATVEVLWPDAFSLDQYVVSLLTMGVQASVGEIGLTRLAMGMCICCWG